MTTETHGREAERRDFIAAAGWSDARRADLAGDASSRRYERLIRSAGAPAVLMDAPPAAEAPACPPDATPEQRKALGYNALACLAGPNAAPFVALSRYLNTLGFSAPAVLAADLARGLLLLEDLGDDLFARVIGTKAGEAEVYRSAIELLSELHTVSVPRRLPVSETDTYTLHTYDEYALGAECDLLTDWFMPAVLGGVDDRARADFQNLWHDKLTGLQSAPPVLVLRDYHAENLLWLPEREGRARVGLLDFQDGVLGHPAYDLVSLLQDARRDVAPELEADMLDLYCSLRKQNDPAFDADAFRTAYALLGLQRNTKIIGIFTRLAKRDHKPKYLGFMPRLWRYMDRGFAHPDAKPLQQWFDRWIPESYRIALDEHQLK